MESIVLIMKLMPQIKLYVIYKHGAITFKNTMIEVIYAYKMDSMMHISNEQLQIICIRKIL